MKLGRTVVTVLWSSLFLVLAGCGDSDQPFASGVDNSKTVSSYTESDAQKFCNSEAAFVNGRYSRERRCMAQTASLAASLCSVSDAEMQEKCRSNYDKCISDPTSVKDLDPSDCIATLPGATCPATTTELNACVNEMTSSLDAILAKIPSCSVLKSELCLELKNAFQSDTEPCSALRATCPEVVSALN